MSSPLFLIASILLGCGLGVVLKDKATLLKPFGDLFLNLLFTMVVPLVFFSLSSAIAGMTDLKRLGKIMFWMMVIFITTGVVSSVIMLIAVTLVPVAQGFTVNLPPYTSPDHLKMGEQLVKAFTVSDFADLLSKKNMLALIVFAILIGVSALAAKPKTKPFIDFLVAGNEVSSKAITYIMMYAPIGLGAYFAYLVGVLGPQSLGTYVRVVALYYPVAIFYFFFAFSFYVYTASGLAGVKSFWRNIIPVALTAWGTGSSVASIPVNLEAAKRIGIPQDVREVVIPIGATIHMEGSCLSAVLKIALLFGLFQMPFNGFETIVMAIGIAILSGTVMSGIPGGGFLGELLIVTMYGFPVEALPIISIVGTLVDPPATMINSVGDNVAGMLVSRILGGRSR